MLVSYFIKHQWKRATRSSIWQKSLALNLLLGFFALILFAEALIISILVAHKWHEITDADPPLADFYKVIAWYFAGMFLLRFFMQQLPVLEVRPYQHLPVKKRSLIHFILGNGLLNLFNLFSLVFFIPFSIAQVSFYHGAWLAFAWLLAMLALDFSLNYFVIYLKKQMVSNLKVVTLLLAFVGLLALTDYLKWFSFSETFASLISGMMENPILLAVPFILLILVYKLNFRFLRSRLYLEEIASGKGDGAGAGQIGYLKRFGMTGEVIGIDIKLYLRNKRTKSMLYLSPLFLGYGLFFYPSGQYSHDDGFMIFVGIFMTGIMMLNYLQYAFAYEGSYFDLLLTSRINFKEYIRSKMLFATLITIVCYILTLPYGFFGIDLLWVNTACFLFNIGILLPTALYFATYNKKSLVLTRGSAFNYQGVGATHWLIMLPAFIVPLIIYLPFKWFGNAEAGLIVLGGLGLVGLAFRKFFTQIIHQNLQARKYIMSAGFREKN
jgi:hypothetical protein